MTDHLVMRAVVEFLKTRPTKEQFNDLTRQLWLDHPAERARLVLFRMCLEHPEEMAQLALAGQLIDQKIEAAGFSEHPEDYLWRPVLKGVLTFRDLKDGTADLADVVKANDVLDRQEAGFDQNLADVIVVRMVRQLHESDQLPKRKNGSTNISQTTELVRLLIAELPAERGGRKYKKGSSYLRAKVGHAVHDLEQC